MPVPEGFVLDNQPTPPEGFVLDAPQTFTDKVKGVAGKVAKELGGVGEAIRYGVNTVATLPIDAGNFMGAAVDSLAQSDLSRENFNRNMEKRSETFKPFKDVLNPEPVTERGAAMNAVAQNALAAPGQVTNEYGQKGLNAVGVPPEISEQVAGAASVGADVLPFILAEKMAKTGAPAEVKPPAGFVLDTPEAVRPTHDNLAGGIPAADSLSLQNAAPEVKPVVKGTKAEILDLKKQGATEGKVIHTSGDTAYVLDPNAVQGIYGGSVPESLRMAKLDLKAGGDAESKLLGYPSREGAAPGQTIDAAVTKTGEVVTDLPQMKAEKYAGNIAWAAEGKPEEVTAKAQEVAAAIKPQSEVIPNEGRKNAERNATEGNAEGRQGGLQVNDVQPGEAPQVTGGQSDRRADYGRRQQIQSLIDSGDLEGAHKLVYEDPLTGLLNKRAWDQTESQASGKTIALMDMSGLKYANDTFGYDAGDSILKAMADALKDHGIEAYRKGGDEITAVFERPAQAEELLQKAQETLANKPIEVTAPDGQVRQYKGWRFDYGTGQDFTTANGSLKARRSELSTTGQRSERGARPVGVVEAVPEGLKADHQVILPNEGIHRPGPGANTATSPYEAGSEISQLRGAIPPDKPVKTSFLAQAKADAVETATGLKETAQKSFAALKDIGQKIWEGYAHPPEWTDFKNMLGKYDAARQKSSLEASRFAKDIQQSVHPRVQEGITNWIEANGDMALLQERANSTANPKLKQGYIDAANLTPDQMRLAENVKNYFEARLQQAQEAGVLDQGVENFVHRIWEKGKDPLAKKVSGEANMGMLQTNPGLARKRVFETFHEGEQLGSIPKDKRIGYLLTAYDQALNEAINARAFVKSLMDGKAKDGRPLAEVSGSGKQMPNSENPDSYIVRPKTKPEEAMDYRSINHPAMRKWKWASQDGEGNPILVQGDIVVHPEVYRHLNNVLGKSKIREFEVAGYRPGKEVLNGIQTLKSTLLSLSGFHQVQEGVHAVGHEVNPFSVPEINLEHPTQLALAEHGLMVFNHNALSEFGEGVHAAGLVSKVPIIGRQMKVYGEYLFQNYIPRLKMKMALDAYERNTKRYSGKLNDDQILELSAKESNAAFGELNYNMIGRSKTIQDMFRLVALAPDFLEARAKFVGQALKPYGREQAAALLRLSAYMAVTAQTLNYIINKEFDWTRPFSLKINDKYYTLRSVPGDLIHLVTDPRSFTYNRLNPTLARPTIEALTGRDQYGRKRDLLTQLEDFAKAHAPIPIQGPLWKHDSTLVDSILGSAGIGSNKARTPAEIKAIELHRENMPQGRLNEDSIKHYHLVNDLAKGYKEKQDVESIRRAYQAGLITDKDVAAIEKRATVPDLVRTSENLTLEQTLDVYEKASPQERQLLTPLVERKANTVDQAGDVKRIQAVLPRMQKLFAQ